MKRSPKGQLSTEAKLTNVHTDELITDRLSSRGKSRGTSDEIVSEAVGSILGLDFEAFTRSVMLAQGDFAAFLKANAEERRTILEATTGSNIYDLLKEALNTKVRESKEQYEQEEARFDAIPMATCEEIETAKVRQEALRANAEKLEQKQRNIRGRREQESYRVEVHQQLTEVESRYTELEGQQDKIEQKQSELALAHRAERLRPQQNAFQSEQAETTAANEKFEEAERALARVQQKYKASQDEFEKIDLQYQEVVAERDAKMEAYHLARTEEIEAQGQFDRLKERQADAQTIEEGINDLSKNLASQKGERDTLAQQIEADQTFLDENPIPNDSDERLSSARERLVQLDGKQESLSEKADTRDELRSKTTHLNRQLAESEERGEGQLAEKVDADAIVTRAETELQAQQARGSLEVWEARKEGAQQLQPIASDYEDATRQLETVQVGLTEIRRGPGVRCIRFGDPGAGIGDSDGNG